MFRRDRNKGKGGGVLIYVRESIQCNQIDIHIEDFECVGVRLVLSPEMSFVVLAVYRPPNATNDFFDSLFSVLKLFEGKEILLMGDFNLNWLDTVQGKKNQEHCQYTN